MGHREGLAAQEARSRPRVIRRPGYHCRMFRPARLAAMACLAMMATARAWADPLPAHAARVVSYSIDVTLDATTHTLTGVERVSWHNSSSDAVSDLWFHLYLNAFRNTNSTFVKESGGQLRGVEIVPGGWGWIDLTKLAVANGGTDLLRGATMMAPDDGNADDRTVLRTRVATTRPARRRHHARHHLYCTAAARVRPHRLRQRLLPGRPMVPEAGGLRSSRHTRAHRRRLELPPVPRQFRVLRGLRQLRCPHHHARALRRRRHGTAEELDA